ARRLHGRPSAQARQVRVGQPRHDLPRRDRRSASGPPGQAPACPPGWPVLPRGRALHHQGRRAGPGRHQPEPGAGRGGRTLPRRPLLSAERGPDRRAGPARATGRDSPPRSVLRESLREAFPARRLQPERRHTREHGALSVSRQCPRAREHRQAHDRPRRCPAGARPLARRAGQWGQRQERDRPLDGQDADLPQGHLTQGRPGRRAPGHPRRPRADPLEPDPRRQAPRYQLPRSPLQDQGRRPDPGREVLEPGMRDDLRHVADEEETPQKGVAVERLRAAWSRRKWLGVLVFILPFTAAVTVILSLPTFYRSTAVILVDRQQVPETFVPATVTSELETRLHTISQEILSRARLDALITRFGLYPAQRKQAQTEELVERMRKDIKLELKTTTGKEGYRSATTAFTISYRGPDPQTVAQVTNSLASFYIEENLKVRERQATGTAEFLKVQLTDTRKRLDELETRVSDFRRR